VRIALAMMAESSGIKGRDDVPERRKSCPDYIGQYKNAEYSTQAEIFAIYFCMI
jgi:hypothetical protein